MSRKHLKEVEKIIKGYTNRPFKIEPNHQSTRLKVLIDGCSTPFFTNATPSGDKRALLNFISDIRRHFKQQGIEPTVNTMQIAEDKLSQALKDLPEPAWQQPEPLKVVQEPELTDEELELLTAPTITETIVEEDKPMKTTQELANTATTEFHAFMCLDTAVRIECLSTLSNDQLTQLADDCANAIDSKQQTAAIKAAELIEAAGLDINEVAALLGQTVTTPQPTKLNVKTSTIREDVIAWAKEEIKAGRKVSAKEALAHWEDLFPEYMQPAYNTVWNWINAAKK